MSDEELESLISIYGTEKNEIQYLLFINNGNPFNATNQSADLNENKKQTYVGHVRDFRGEEQFDGLIFKIKAMIKKDRIRLLEFFQDHDVLRKGIVTC